MGIGLFTVLLGSTAVDGSLSLTERSPFLPPDFGDQKLPLETAETKPVGSLILNGVYRLDGRDFAQIEDTSTGNSMWLEQDQIREGLLLLTFDESGNSCRVQLPDGKVETLHLRELPVYVTGNPVQPGSQASRLAGNHSRTMNKAANRSANTSRNTANRVSRSSISRQDNTRREVRPIRQSGNLGEESTVVNQLDPTGEPVVQRRFTPRLRSIVLETEEE